MAGLLQLQNHAADVLKAGEHRADLHAVGSSHPVGQRRGDNALHGHGLLGELAGLLKGGEDVVQEHAAHFVAGELAEAVALGNGHGDAVGIGVGGHDQVRLHFFGQGIALVEGGVVLGVGVGAGGEVAGGILLGGGHPVGGAQALQDLLHRLAARAAQGRIDDLELSLLHVFGGNGLLGNALVVGLPHVLGDILDGALCKKALVALLLGLEEIHGLHGGGDGSGGNLGHLAAVGAVALEAVILLGVVAGGDHHAHAAL